MLDTQITLKKGFQCIIAIGEQKEREVEFGNWHLKKSLETNLLQ